MSSTRRRRSTGGSLVFPRRYRVWRVLPVAAALGALRLVGGCDDSIAPVPTKQANQTPETNLHVEADSLAPQFYRLQLRWLGSDPDGYVVGYRWRWRCPPGVAPCLVDTSWVQTEELSLLFILPVPNATARYVFDIAAVDDDGAADTTPAQQAFELHNEAPVVAFQQGTLPVRTLPAVTFYMRSADPDSSPRQDDLDSRATLSHYRAWLDGAEGQARNFPIAGDAVTMGKADFGGRYGVRTIFVQVVDDGTATSGTVQHTWQVQEPPEDGILLVDDCRMGGFLENFSDGSFRRVLEAAAPGRYVVHDIETIPRLNAADLEATLALFDRVVWYTGADTTSSGALQQARGGLDSLLSRGGKLFLSSGLAFGTRSVFSDQETRFRDFFGIAEVFRAPNGGTNFSMSLADTVWAAVHPGLTRLRFLNQGLRAIMECFESRQGPDTRSLYFYPESTFVRPSADSSFVNPVRFDIGVQHDLSTGASTAYVSFPIGIPINDNMGENEKEILEILKLCRVLEP